MFKHEHEEANYLLCSHWGLVKNILQDIAAFL